MLITPEPGIRSTIKITNKKGGLFHYEAVPLSTHIGHNLHTFIRMYGRAKKSVDVPLIPKMNKLVAYFNSLSLNCLDSRNPRLILYQSDQNCLRIQIQWIHCKNGLRIPWKPYMRFYLSAGCNSNWHKINKKNSHRQRRVYVHFYTDETVCELENCKNWCWPRIFLAELLSYNFFGIN